MKKDALGERLKGYEARETERKFLPYLPVYARIDGRSFSKFTKMAKKPFDHSITTAMQAATRELIAQTHAKIGYVQSDEISLVWETTSPDEGMFFDGKVQKICSVISGIATAAFIRALIKDPEWMLRNPDWLEKMPHFDARVIQLPTRTEAANMFVWREMDARKNAISMVAHSMFSHKSLQGKSGKEKLEMINAADGMKFEDYSPVLRRGAFMRRVSQETVMPETIRMAIPEKNRPEAGSMMMRSSIQVIDMPVFTRVLNRNEVIFEGANPIVEEVK